MNRIEEEFSIWLSSLTNDQIEKIKANQVNLNYNKGEIICKQGGFASHIIFLSEGLVKIYKEHNEKNLILQIVKPGELIGLSSLYNKGVFNYSAATIDRSKVYSINADIIKYLIKNNADFSEKIITLLNLNTTQYFERLISLTQKQLHGRIADAILHLAREIYQKDSFNMLLSRRDLAEFCGMSTESAIRILKEFHNDKIVNIEGKKLDIISYSLLERLSEVG
ncbi:MAG: Crp/Fnr family transcriptional regulator [Salinivirgaceae bacterium]|nr:Crp/Fnr family transcriptional regulator [Salinivirgaceae bacterium]